MDISTAVKVEMLSQSQPNRCVPQITRGTMPDISPRVAKVRRAQISGMGSKGVISRNEDQKDIFKYDTD